MRTFTLMVAAFALGLGASTLVWHAELDQARSQMVQLIESDRKLKAADAELKAANDELRDADMRLQGSCALLKTNCEDFRRAVAKAIQ